ncbi:MAG TPA: methionine synthase [Pseudonocardiaceae bacterium]|nr:methionine synthase [Pseudonocardiaceae bacterium]
MSSPWSPGVATAIGSMPGVDPTETARLVYGELPELPYLPELPARGLGADLLGRTAALLVDLPFEVVPSGYRVTAHPGADQRRAVELMRRDLDALQEAADHAGGRPNAVKVQVAGPWTLTADIELVRGHRVLTDAGALREFGQSLAEGLTAHIAEVAARTGAPVLVQLDEPTLPTVLAGRLPTPSGFGTVAAVGSHEAVELLSTVIEAARAASGNDVIVHCCAARPPIALLREAGADALSLDATLLVKGPAAVSDALGEAWDAGTVLLLGLVPGLDPATPLTLHEAAKPALELVDRLGFPRTLLAERAVPTPCCGLAGATVDWARRALTLTRELGAAFHEPPESWGRGQ